MVVIALVVFWILLSALTVLDARIGPAHDDVQLPAGSAGAPGVAAVDQAEMLVDIDHVRDRWTALDDRQLARLLDNSSPC